jgi:hypothetical protein
MLINLLVICINICMPAGKKEKREALFLENVKKHPQGQTLVPDITTYKGTHSYISFNCIKHNTAFTVKGTVINLGKGGCPACSEEARLLKHRSKITPTFIKKSKEIHGEKYDYSEVVYVNQYTAVQIICPTHGAFLQTPTTHIHCRCGCPSCSESSGERAIGQYLRANNIKFEFQYFVEINKSRHYFDFYLPEYNLIIEYDGKQHFDPIKYFGGVNTFKKIQKRDAIKNKYCEDNRIKLARVPYTCNNIDDTLAELIKQSL